MIAFEIILYDILNFENQYDIREYTSHYYVQHAETLKLISFPERPHLSSQTAKPVSTISKLQIPTFDHTTDETCRETCTTVLFVEVLFTNTDQLSFSTVLTSEASHQQTQKERDE